MDITQEAFLRVFRGIPSFQLGKPFLPWVYRITWNLCADRGRKIGRSLPEESLDGNEITRARVSSEEPAPDQIYENKELRETLKQAVNKLKDGYRELIILFHVEGLSINEISEITGINATVIKNRLYRGRQALKKILLEDGFSW